jgi:hypothetical protein
VATHTRATIVIRRGVGPLLATGALLVATATLRAQTEVVAASSSGSKLELRPFVSVYVPIGSQRDLLMDGLGVGAQVSWRASRRLAISGTYGWTQTKDRVTPGDRVLDIFRHDVGLEGRVPAWRSGGSWSTGDPWDITPFVGIGLGGRTSNYRDLDVASMTNFEAYGAAGGEADIGGTGLRFEVRDYVSRSKTVAGGRRSETRTDVALRVGFTLRF